MRLPKHHIVIKMLVKKSGFNQLILYVAVILSGSDSIRRPKTGTSDDQTFRSQCRGDRTARGRWTCAWGAGKRNAGNMNQWPGAKRIQHHHPARRF
ncbi:MAG: hypothetical protein MI802_29190 [Desulfobacterales bacterium]|nr:hypothetical protein [Desulfobacterales bacterium]